MNFKRKENRSKSIFATNRTVVSNLPRNIALGRKSMFYTLKIKKNAKNINNYIKLKSKSKIKNIKLLFKKKEIYFRKKTGTNNNKPEYFNFFLDMNKLKNDIKEFSRILYQYLILKKDDQFYLQKFFKSYISFKSITNKKFKFVFLNRNFELGYIKRKKGLRYTLYCMLFFSIGDFILFVSKKKKIEFKSKNFDNTFYKEIKKFLIYLKKKTKIEQENKLIVFENKAKKIVESIKSFENKKNKFQIQKQNFRIKKLKKIIFF